VAPEDSKTKLANFPYFLDFEPKKRELFELASDTKEKMSRSIESLNLTKSAGTTQSTEVFDIDMGGGGFSQQGSFAGTGGGFSYSAPNGQHGTKRMNAEESMSSRAQDVGQEKRETFSYTTQISQMYHQLDSYHLGTNRALFFIHPRPHTLQTEFTFVNGPRNIEGIQEFMLVVARPKEIENICVEAYLETGHIFKDSQPASVPEPREIPGTEITVYWPDAYSAAPRGDDDETPNVDNKDKFWYVKDYDSSYKIKDAKITVGPEEKIVKSGSAPQLVDVIPVISAQTPDVVRVSGSVHSWFHNGPGFSDDNEASIKLPFTVEIILAKFETISKEKAQDTLFITGRKLCCCPLKKDFRVLDEGIVFEKVLDTDRYQFSKSKMPIIAANRLGDEIKEGIINSRTDLENRYETFVHLPQTDFANKVLVNVIRESRDLTLRNSRNIPEKLRKKLSALNPEVKIKDILSMPFEMQKDLFSMNDKEVIELRNAITGLSHKDFDPKEAWLSQPQIDRMFGKDKKTD